MMEGDAFGGGGGVGQIQGSSTISLSSEHGEVGER